jgi:hypothetical protein
MAEMLRVVSISLGPSSRDKAVEVSLLGRRFMIERIGTDGHIDRFARFLRQYDGVADVLCLGGINIALRWRETEYPVRQVHSILRKVRKTPVVDGSGLRATLEPLTLDVMQEAGIVDLEHARALMVNAFDRYWLAKAIADRCGKVIYGDMLFSFGMPLPVRSLQAMDSWARVLLPVITRLPHQWAYSSGIHSNHIVPGYGKYYEWADLVAGDFGYIRHYMARNLEDKVVLTNTTTPQDVHLLAERGVKYLVTTTPEIEGRTFAMNVTEGVFAALLGRPPDQITAEDYVALAQRLGWQPHIRQLSQS